MSIIFVLELSMMEHDGPLSFFFSTRMIWSVVQWWSAYPETALLLPLSVTAANRARSTLQHGTKDRGHRHSHTHTHSLTTPLPHHTITTPHHTTPYQSTATTTATRPRSTIASCNVTWPCYCQPGTVSFPPFLRLKMTYQLDALNGIAVPWVCHQTRSPPRRPLFCLLLSVWSTVWRRSPYPSP